MVGKRKYKKRRRKTSFQIKLQKLGYRNYDAEVWAIAHSKLENTGFILRTDETVKTSVYANGNAENRFSNN